MCTEWIFNFLQFFSLCLLGIQITVEAQEGCGPTVKDFKLKVESDEGIRKKIEALRSDVEAFALSFPMPGHDDI